MATDLFGNPITDAEATAKGKPRRANAPQWKGGYAAQPGTGPAGETCRSCDHYVRRGGASRVYLKCDKLVAWTRGPATDIKAGSPACSFWEKKITLEGSIDL